MKRCKWVDLKEAIYIDYHDNEWGVPKYNDKDLFELLALESLQAGLSWICILKKRQDLRCAFDNFDYELISLYDEDKINKLLENKKIIRNRRKIEAIIINAKIFKEIRCEWGSFSNYIWHFTDGKIIKNDCNKILSKNSLSDKISNDLKTRGMKYVGSIIIYSYLQSIGIINDHEVDCFLHQLK